MNKIIFLLLFLPIYGFGQKIAYINTYIPKFKTYFPTLYVQWDTTKVGDTLVHFPPGSKLYTYLYDEIKKELSVINILDEGDMCSYWYHISKFDEKQQKWESVGMKGIDVFVYRRDKHIKKYKFIDTRNLEIIDEASQKKVAKVIFKDDHSFKYEEVKE